MSRLMGSAAARQPTSPVLTSGPEQKSTPHTLTWLARTFELAQRERIRRGERIRAIAQARELSRLLEDAVTQHPAWPWLMQVRGVGRRLAARLLSRLRIELARSPSAFWAYCALATVQAVEYRCACAARPRSRRPEESHRRATFARTGSRARAVSFAPGARRAVASRSQSRGGWKHGPTTQRRRRSAFSSGHRSPGREVPISSTIERHTSGTHADIPSGRRSDACSRRCASR